MNEEGTLDDRYLEWLYEQIGSPGRRNPARAYWKLAKQLYSKKFQWFIHNDDNRSMDGIELRLQFMEEYEIRADDSLWMMLECSMLEMLIALSRRVSFESDRPPDEWFWKFMENLGLQIYTDSKYNDWVRQEVNETLNRVIDRTFDIDGNGGIFPLRNPHRDQRQIEIWYQMSDYLMESSYVDNVP